RVDSIHRRREKHRAGRDLCLHPARRQARASQRLPQFRVVHDHQRSGPLGPGSSPAGDTPVSLGFRVITDITRPQADLVEKFMQYRSCDLSDVMNRSGTMVGIHPVFTPIPRAAGPAVTISIPAGGINMIKLGIDQARSGDVIVVSAQGSTTFAMMGGNISLS